MSGDLLFLVATLAIWLGTVFLVRGVWIGTKWMLDRRNRSQSHSLLTSLCLGGVLLTVGSTIPHAVPHGKPAFLSIPVVWPIMPFPAWFIVVAIAMVAMRGVQVLSALNREDKRKIGLNALGWIAFGLANLAWFKAMSEPITLLRGSLPLETPAALGLLVLLSGSLLLIQLLSHSFQARGLGRSVATYSALVVGSAMFCLPLVWLLLTSFKEKEDNTGSGLVWVPMVTERHGFLDDKRPLVTTHWRGQKVWATIVDERKGGPVTLDIERPFPLRGWRFEAERTTLRSEERSGIVVTTTYQGQPVKGFVREDLVGGVRQVEILEPPTLKGRIFETTANETKPVRHVGVRWENYSEAIEWLPPETGNGLKYLQNTLWLVVMSVTGTLLSCSMVAYGFARVRFPGRGALFSVMLVTMMLPGAVTMMPRFLIWRGLGAIDTLVPIWLPTFTASAFYVFLLREFFRTVPKELEDAAKMDGCTPFRTYWQVMLPQIKPALTVIAIWTFMGAWNDFMSPLIYVSSAEKMPISYAIQLFSTDKGGEFGLMMAFATMATIPVLIVFCLGQKYFVEGVQLSGLANK